MTKSRTKSVIIYAEDSSRLRLSRTRLVQIDHPRSLLAWYATAASLRKAYQCAYNNEGITLYRSDSSRLFPRFVKGLLFRIPGYGGFAGEIGCCVFSPKVFKQIMRTVGARKTARKRSKNPKSKAGK